MKKLTALLALLMLSGCANIKIGVGYKFDQPEIRWDDGTVGDHPISARLEMYNTWGNWHYGISHHSQYFQHSMESHKTEFFIDYNIKVY